MHHTGNQRHCGHLGGGCEKRGDRGRRAFIDIGGPHVEGGCGHLKGHARDQEDQTDQQTQRRVAFGQGGRNPCKQRGAGKAVNQRCTVQQQTRGQRTKDKVFQASFGGLDRVTAQRGHDVQRQRLQFEAHVQNHQISRRHHHHHADGAQRHKDRIFEPRQIAPRHIVLRHRQHACCRQQDHHLGKARKGVIDEHAAKGDGPFAVAQGHQQRQRHKQPHCGPCDRGRQLVLAAVDAKHQRGHGIDRQKDLGQQDRKINSSHRIGPSMRGGLCHFGQGSMIVSHKLGHRRPDDIGHKRGIDAQKQRHQDQRRKDCAFTA